MPNSFDPDQYCLFDAGPNLARLREQREELMRHSKAPNTLRAYAHSWKSFSTWCAEFSKCPLPAAPDTVSLFLTWAADRYKCQTIQGYLAAINYRHRKSGHALPMDEEVRSVLAAIVRRKAREEGRRERAGKDRLTPELLRKICRTLRDDDPFAARDRAILLLGFASAWRGCEICALRCEHVTFEPEGMRIWIPFSKTDQEGEGRSTTIPCGECEYTCPVRAMKIWIGHRGGWRGPLFVQFKGWGYANLRPLQEGLKATSICAIVKRALWRVEEDSRRYGGHSLRSGMITAASEAGASIRSIMDRTGHKCYATVHRYVKSSSREYACDPLKGVL